VERSTFVVVGVGAERFGVPVELVERVERIAPTAGAEPVRGDGVLVVPLDEALGLARGANAAGAAHTPAHTRVLIVRDRERRWAVPVETVYEVCAVETASIVPWAADAAGPRREPRVATFERLGQTIIVLDLLRLLPDSAS
jgi:chemotaxis signal transduction protein